MPAFYAGAGKAPAGLLDARAPATTTPIAPAQAPAKPANEPTNYIGGGVGADPVLVGAPDGPQADPNDLGLLGQGRGSLAGRLANLPPASLLAAAAPGFKFMPVKDISGNVWWLIVGVEESGQFVPLNDFASILRFFVFGRYNMTYTRNRTQSEMREEVDIPNISQYSNYDNVDARALAVFYRVRALVRTKLNYLTDDGAAAFGAVDFGGNSYDGNPVNYYFGAASPGANTYYENHGSDPYDSLYSPPPLEPTGGPPTTFYLPYWKPEGTTNTSGGTGVRFDDPAAAAVISTIDNIPFRLPGLKPLGFNGQFWGVGDAWSRIAVLKDYDRTVYPAKFFGHGVVNTSAVLDEARTVETVHQSIKAVGDLVNGIMTFNFSPLTDSLTSAVNGAALANIRGYELKLRDFATSSVKMGFGYGRALLEISQLVITQDKDKPPSIDASEDGTFWLKLGAGLALAALVYYAVDGD